MTLKWDQLIKELDYAFQPIVHTYTGKIYGVEALLRNVNKTTPNYSIQKLFDKAFEENMLNELDLALREKAIKKFSTIKIENLRLFYNLDNRILYNRMVSQGYTNKLLEQHNLQKNAITFELSEKGSLVEQNAMNSMIVNYRSKGYSLAIDDFGIGVSGLKLLYFAEANFIKIGRYFISRIDQDSKKKLFCSSIVDMAHIMGIKVIAVGVETQKEFYTCKNIGIDFIQGYLVQKAYKDISKIKPIYSDIVDLIKKDRRVESKNSIDSQYITYIKPLNINSSLHELFLYFKENPQNTFVPIINDFSNIQGVIYEVDIKKISYSQYGLSLAKNLSYNENNFHKYIKPALSVEANWGIDKTLEMYNQSHEHSKGIFVTNANAYIGFIEVNSLLSLSYKRNIEIATDQNPLTKLPGNEQIETFIYEAIKDKKNYSHMLYFDFNDFKPFNDHYGFRQGDRAILLFSELLQKSLDKKDAFIAHVGGDDFFIGFKNCNFKDVYTYAHQIQKDFQSNTRNLYNKNDKENGYVMALDRFNIKRKFDLLSVSCAIIEVAPKRNKNHFDQALGLAKKASKKSQTPVAVGF